MIGKSINEVAQARLVIELQLKLVDHTMEEDVDPETIREVLDPGCLLPDTLGHFYDGTHLLVK
jgi:hypothetical protein